PPASAAAARPARDQPDAAVPRRHALEQLARIPIRALMEDEASLEQHRFSVGHRNPSDVEAETLQLPLAVRPVLAYLRPHLEVHAAAEQIAKLETRFAAHLLQHLAAFADHDRLVAFAFEPDQRVHDPAPVFALLETLDLDADAVRHFLMQHVHQLLPHDLGGAKRDVAVRLHLGRKERRPGRSEERRVGKPYRTRATRWP